MLDRLNDILGGTGLFARGGFHCEVGDNVPNLLTAAPQERYSLSVTLVRQCGGNSKKSAI